MRMDEKRTPKRILEWKPVGTRIRGRPKETWIVDIEEDKFQFRGSVHHTMIIENTSLMQQDNYIFHLYVFSTCFGRDIAHHQELQNCIHSDMVMVPREVPVTT